jgi:hypothetical protein
MAFAFPHPTHLPCPDCGKSLAVNDDQSHECDEELKFWFKHREEIEDFDQQLTEWLKEPEGRFFQWLAERNR